jgi:tRNA (cmo5U34)-methyltransferase
MEAELSEMLGRKADLHTPEELSRYFRDGWSEPPALNMNAHDRSGLRHMLDAAAEALVHRGPHPRSPWPGPNLQKKLRRALPPSALRFMSKSTPDEIRRRFDADVERFSNLETGQTATMDAPVSLELIARAAAAVCARAEALLDIGCGAGNYTLRLMRTLPLRRVTLVDLSRPMLQRAEERVRAAGLAEITAVQADIRQAEFPAGSFDVAVAAATLHHLRGDEEWSAVFGAICRWLRPGGSLWISDMVDHRPAAIQEMLWKRYGEYLEALQGPEYRNHVFAYIDREDTPRPLVWQLDRLRRAGFATVEVLHKNTCFAAFGAIK